MIHTIKIKGSRREEKEVPRGMETRGWEEQSSQWQGGHDEYA